MQKETQPQKGILVRLMLLVMAAVPCHASAQAPYRFNKDVAALQIRTNALYDIAVCPNIGLEIQTDLGVAWELDYTGAWWNKRSKNRFFSNYAFMTELRYYLACTSQDTPYRGHHIGVYAQMGTYDFEFGGKGILARDLDKSYALGISYGYAYPLSRHFSIGFAVGLGYFNTTYDVYEPYQNGYMRTGTRQLKWYGPTKIEISLAWNINSKNSFPRK